MAGSPYASGGAPPFRKYCSEAKTLAIGAITTTLYRPNSSPRIVARRSNTRHRVSNIFATDLLCSIGGIPLTSTERVQKIILTRQR